MSDEEDFETIECITHFNWTSKLIRVIEDVLVPSTIKFRIEFMPMETAGEDDLEKAFTKIRYWLDNVINKSVVFAHHNVGAIKMFIDETGSNTRIANMLVMTPDEPDDQHLAAIFQAKLQALAGGSMAFGPVDVKSDNTIGLTYTFVGDSTAILPDADNWFAERRFFDAPWWDRDDGSTIDTVPSAEADLSIKPSYAFSFDFLDRPKMPQQQTGAIVRHEFRPTVIDGGKDKE